MTFIATSATEICPVPPHKPTSTLAKRAEAGTLISPALVYPVEAAGPRPDPISADGLAIGVEEDDH